jgi:dipeptidyl aminopeptidase/acylaminoacyl peptidase
MGPTTAVGGGLLVAASLPAVAVIHGSPWMAVGLIGFLVWMLFLALSGVALLQRSAVKAVPVGG